MKPTRRVAVLGSGSWGTALAHHVRRAGAEVTLWGRDEAVLRGVAERGENPEYLKGRSLAKGIIAETDLAKAVTEKDLIIVAVPASALRKVLSPVSAILKSSGVLMLSGIKGLEAESFKTATQVIADEIGGRERVAALGGPSFAAEVVEGFPTAVTIAAYDLETAKTIRSFLHFGNVRVYTSTDVIGVELGGAVKNVIALATGLVDGVGMGHNARAALITRGLAEIQNLVVAMGGDPRTIAGLAGLGDLLLTAVGDLSRNRQVGLRLGKGEKLADITASLGEVAEGVRSTHLVLELAKAHGVSMPIVEQTDAVLLGSRSVADAVGALLAREPKEEFKQS